MAHSTEVGSILSIVTAMGGEVLEQRIPIIKSIVGVECACGRPRLISAEALYRQSRRGHNKYICPSCSAKAGWTKAKRKVAGDKSRLQWDDTNYAGTIIGKAVARDIERLT